MRTTNPTQLAGASPRYLTDRSIKRRTTTEALPLARLPYKYGNKAEELGSHAAESDRLSPVCEVFARSPSTNTDNIVLRAGTSTFGGSGMITQ